MLAHGPIVPLVDGVWRVVGALPRRGPIERTMTVLRRADGSLVVHSGIAMDEASMAALERLGSPSAIVVPNAWHRMDAPYYAARYPNAVVHCPHRARARVSRVVRVTGDYATFEAGDDVALEYLPGVTKAEGVVIHRGADGTTLVFNDLLLNLPRLSGGFGLVFGVLGGHGRPCIHRGVGLMMVRRRQRLFAALRRWADDPALCCVVPGHGDAVTDDPAAFLRAIIGS